MGMCLTLIRLSDATIAELRDTPAKALHFWMQDDLPEAEPVGFLGRLLGKKPNERPKCSAPRSEGDEADMDKAWDAVDYLISEKRRMPGVARFLTEGGSEIPEELGYGNPRIFDSAEVREISRFLEPITVETLRTSYDAEKMDQENVYPEIWVKGGAELFEYVATNFTSMKSLVRDAAGRNEGIMIICS